MPNRWWLTGPIQFLISFPYPIYIDPQKPFNFKHSFIGPSHSLELPIESEFKQQRQPRVCCVATWQRQLWVVYINGGDEVVGWQRWERRQSTVHQRRRAYFACATQPQRVVTNNSADYIHVEELSVYRSKANSVEIHTEVIGASIDRHRVTAGKNNTSRARSSSPAHCIFNDPNSTLLIYWTP